MTHPNPSYLVAGTLLDQQKILHEIEFVIVTKKPPRGQRGSENEAVSEMKLAHISPVPDGGPYMLQYVFNGKKHEDQVRVIRGMLISA